MAMRLLDLFSGIGGFSYAAEKLIGGYETVAFCEMDDFCQKVLKKHWPQVPIFDDVRTLDASRLGRIDIVTGGYPCQPFSQAGRRQGEEDERHLWPEMLRIIKSCQPRYVLAENVAGHVTMGLDQVLTDLEDQGYTTRAIIVPACAKNAPHRRDRVWIIGQNVDDTNDSTDRAKRGKTREKDSLQKEYRQKGFAWFSDRTSDDSEPMADSENVRGQQTEWQGWESSRRGSQDIIGSETERKETDRTDVANSDSIRCRGGSCKGCSDCKRQVLSTERKGREVGSEVKGCSQSHRGEETVANTSSIRQSRSRKSVEPISSEENKTRKTSWSNDGSQRGKHDGNIEQRVGDMVNGLSRGLLRHFDREPEHIPRVTKGEKDRAKKLKALGNSIVPQVAAEILLAIRVSEGEENGSN